MASRFDVVRHLVAREVTQALAGASAGATAGASEEAGLLALVRELEDLKAIAAAAQAELAVAYDNAVQARRAAEGVSARRRDRGIAAEVAIARRESPHRGARLLGLAHTLVEDLPHTLAAVRTGTLSEYRASVVATETSSLSQGDRAAADAELCGDRARMESWGTARLAAEARKVAYRLDPVAFVGRASRARNERHVSLRPAPDTMTWLGALLPVEHGVAVRATLGRLADTAVAGGDGRSRAQVMADALVQTLTGLDLGVPTGQPHDLADPGDPGDRYDAVPVQVHLTVSDQTLLGGGVEPAWLHDYGPLPAPLARDLVSRAEAQACATLRRLYVAPDTGALVGMDARSRLFPRGLALLVTSRDQTCRTPWCDAPIRHLDHVVDWAAGGETSAANGQGLCERCNHDKQATGWRTDSTGPPGGRHETDISSPSGFEVRSRAPDLPLPRRHPTGPGATDRDPVVVEIYRSFPELSLDLGELTG